MSRRGSPGRTRRPDLKPSVSRSFPKEREAVDFYRQARDAWLRDVFPAYPDLSFESFTIAFDAGRAPNSYLAFAILDTFPDVCVSTDGSGRLLLISDFQLMLESIDRVSDLISVASGWKTFRMELNGKEIDWCTIKYVTSFWRDAHNCVEARKRNTEEIKKAYISRPKPKQKRPSRKQRATVGLDANNIGAAVKLVADVLKEEYLSGYDVVESKTGQNEVVLVVEGELVISVGIFIDYRCDSPKGEKKTIRYNGSDSFSWYHCVIQEQTPNQFFRLNESDFRTRFRCSYCSVDILRYKGFKHYWGDESYRGRLDLSEALVAGHPELKIKEKCELYPGDLYHYVVFEMESAEGQLERGIGFTGGKVHDLVKRVCKELETKNSASLRNNGSSSLLYRESRLFIDAFLSWKGKRKLWRLENKLTYFYVDVLCKDERELYFKFPMEILEKAAHGEYDDLDKGAYSKPMSRWKTEELVLSIVKEVYGEYGVVAQYRPHFLQTNTGCMSYDVYIAGLKVALEYQGRQHFEPVSYFGGLESYEKQVERDRLKLRRSMENGVRLAYVNYWDDVTPTLIKRRVKEALSGKPEQAS